MYRRSANVIVCVCLLALAACGGSPSRDEKPQAKPQAGKQSSKRASKDEPAVPEVPLGPPPIPPEATQQFEKALTLLGGGDLAPAEAEFKRLSASYPEYSGPLVNLGVIYLKSGKLNDAEKSLQAAIARSPQNATAFNQLGIVYRNMGRFKDADTAYSQAIGIDANYALAQLNLGVLCDLYLHQPERALTAFERYLTLTSNPDPKVNNWVKELRSRLGVKVPVATEATKPTEASPPPTEEAVRSEP